MLDIDRVWHRIAQLPGYRNKSLSDFIQQDLTYATQLAAGQAVPNQPVVFPAGAVVVGVRGGASIDAQLATQTQRFGLDTFKLSIADQQTGRIIVGTAQAIATAVFGHQNDQFPSKELIIPAQGGFTYSFTNLTTSIINIAISHSCLVPAVVG
jgi:hypothetical protein